MSHLGRSLRRTPAREHTVLRVAVALAVALALHAGIVLWLARVPWALRAGREAQPVALAPLTAQQWQANRAVGGERAAPAPPPPPAPAPRDERQPKGQFVDLYGAEEPDAAKSKADANARFDSGRDHHAEKETVSRCTARSAGPWRALRSSRGSCGW